MRFCHTETHLVKQFYTCFNCCKASGIHSQTATLMLFPLATIWNMMNPVELRFSKAIIKGRVLYNLRYCNIDQNKECCSRIVRLAALSPGQVGTARHTESHHITNSEYDYLLNIQHLSHLCKTTLKLNGCYWRHIALCCYTFHFEFGCQGSTGRHSL